MSAKLILTVRDSVTAHQLSLFSVYFNNHSQGAPQIVTAAAVVKLRHTLRHSTCVSTGFGIIGRHKFLCESLRVGVVVLSGGLGQLQKCSPTRMVPL